MSSEKILNGKKEVVASLADEFKSAQTIVLAEYLGLTVEQDTQLRNSLREAGVEYKVIKNTMGVLAAKEAGIDGMEDLFKGPTAVAYSSTDVIAPAKILKKFAADHEIFKVKGGASNGKRMQLEELNALADIPELPVLYGKLVGSLVSPISGLAMIVKAIAEKCEENGAATAAEIATNAASTEEVKEAETPVAEEVAAEVKEEVKEETPVEAAE